MKDITQESLRFSLKDDLDWKNIPASPGTYIFLSEKGAHLYIGKAKKLRSRLLSYFRSSQSLPARIRLMMQKAAFLEIILTRTEKEALILEAELIARLRPRYNIRLRDDKAYPYLRLGIKSSYPRLSIVRKRRADKALYFGPFTSSQALRQTLRIIFSVFRLRSCSDAAMKRKGRPCLKYQVKRCSGPCTGAVSREEYMADVKRVRAFLEGRVLFVARQLEESMKAAAAKLEFERAALYRDQLEALKKVLEGQAVVLDSHSNLDVIYIKVGDGTSQAAVLKVREGAIRSRHFMGLDVSAGKDPESSPGDRVYEDFLKVYYSQVTPAGEIIMPVDISEKAAMEELLRHYAGRKVVIRNPRRGKKKALIEMARLNAEQGLRERTAREAGWKKQAALLKRRLFLKRLPHRVEGIDISNISGSLPVGSLVRFEGGRPDKAGYRHYFLDAAGPDDYAMILEVMERRMKRGIKKDDMPDLFIIDGGRGQLGMALNALEKGGFLDSVDVVSIAKDRDGKGEKIFLKDNPSPLVLDRSDSVLRFCQLVRDEAHRFGVKTHRQRRSRQMFDSELLKIPGVGRARQMLLLNHFGSIEKISMAGFQELSAVSGLNSKVCMNIMEYFRREQGRGKD